MKVGGHGVREHLRLLSPLFGLVAAVWFLRLALAAVGTPNSIVRLLSVTIASALALLAAVVLMHLRGFGSYVNVVLVGLLLASWGHLLIVLAIVFSVITGIENIFTEPEYSAIGPDPHHVKHIMGHLTYGIGFGTLISAAVGCLLLFLLRMLVPTRTAVRS